MRCVQRACLFAFIVFVRVCPAGAQPAPVIACGETSAAYQQGFTHLQRREYDQAQRVAKNALRADPANPRLHVLLGVANNAQGNLDEAILAFTNAIRLAPREFWAYANRGAVYAKKGDWARAVADYTEALRLEPNDTLTHVGRALAYKALGEQCLLREDLDAAQRCTGPDRPDEQEQLGHLYGLLGETERAIHWYTEAIHQGLQNVSVYNDRGGLYGAQNDWPRAIADYTEAIRIDPGRVECYCNRATAYWRQRRYAEARADYERACKLRGERLAAYGFARLLATCPDATVRDGKRAVKLARSACEQTGFKDPLCLDVLGCAYAEAGQWDEAVRWAEQALKLAPEDDADGVRLRVDLYRLHEPCYELPADPPADQPPSSAAEAILRALTRRDAGDRDGAIRALRKAVELKPRLIGAQYCLGVALSKRGDSAEAALHFSRCLELDPKHVLALSRRAEEYLVQGMNQVALADAEAALALDPRQIRARYTRAWVLSNLGQVDEALSEADTLNREHIGAAMLHSLRGHCYELQGRYAEAVSEWTAAFMAGRRLEWPIEKKRGRSSIPDGLRRGLNRAASSFLGKEVPNADARPIKSSGNCVDYSSAVRLAFRVGMRS